MQIASQKYDPFYINCYGRDSDKNKLQKNKNRKILIKKD